MMKHNFHPMTLIAWLSLSLAASNVLADTFYCPDGKQMRCLGFGEKVVSSNATCFEPMTCSQEGFVCKSELNSLADEHETLLDKHNGMVNTYNELLANYDSAVAGHEQLQRCLIAATTLAEAKDCL